MNSNRKGTFGILFACCTLFYKMTSGTRKLEKDYSVGYIAEIFLSQFSEFPVVNSNLQIKNSLTR